MRGDKQKFECLTGETLAIAVHVSCCIRSYTLVKSTRFRR